MNTFSANSTDDWRAWLARNWQSEKETWLSLCLRQRHAGRGI